VPAIQHEIDPGMAERPRAFLAEPGRGATDDGRAAGDSEIEPAHDSSPTSQAPFLSRAILPDLDRDRQALLWTQRRIEGGHPMFAAPPSIEARLFARIPDRFHKPAVRSEWTDIQIHGATAPTFLEGPSFDRVGNLFVTDIPWGRIFKIAPDGEVKLAAEY